MSTILIAEDNVDLRHLMKVQLQKHGFTCIESSDGKHVLDALEANSIDLILMDMNMPELDGWEATAMVRAHEQYRSTPIIAITAYSLKGDQARAEAAGCNAFHRKPIEFEQLLIDINLLLQSHSAASPPTQ